MARPVALLLLLLLSLLMPDAILTDPTCVMQGICGKNENGIVPCTVAKEPHKFEDSSDILNILKDECPELFKGSDPIPDVCCSPDDVIKMQQTMQLVTKNLQSCPSCARNVKEFLCHIHCAPNQASFMETIKSSPSANGSAIDTLNYFIKKQSMEDLYNSCAKQPVMKPLVHMGGCEKDCENAREFTRVIGMRKLRSPFDMNIKMVDTGEKITVNGKDGSPAEFLIVKCADSKSCSDTCPV